MFDYSILHWTTFLAAAALLTISPGPDMALILGHTVRSGKRAGFIVMFGIWAGGFVHVFFAAVGLSAILMTSAELFTAVKWAGAAYLIWLGGQALLSRSGAFLKENGHHAVKTSGIFRQGLLVSVLNPKTAVFFLAFLPQFIVEGAGPVSAQLALHGVLVVLVGALIEPPLVLAGAFLAHHLRSSERLGLWLDRTLGALLVSLGLKLAFSERAS